MRRASGRRGGLGSGGSKAIIHEEARAIDEARLVAGEEERRLRHFLRLANASLLDREGGFRNIYSVTAEVFDSSNTLCCLYFVQLPL